MFNHEGCCAFCKIYTFEPNFPELESYQNKQTNKKKQELQTLFSMFHFRLNRFNSLFPSNYI